MTLRRRLSLVAASAVGAAVLLAVLASYLVVRSQLRGQVDSALRAQAEAVRHVGFHALAEPLPGIPPRAGGPAQYAQIVSGDGTVLFRQGGVPLPVSPAVLALAHGTGSASFGDVRVGSDHLREYVFSVPVLIDGQLATAALQLGRPLDATDRVLARLRLMLALLVLGGIALAALLGRLGAARVLVPLAEVADAAERIALTDDLSHRLQPRADDEVGQLARRFNEMLARLQRSRAELDDSVRAQRQLIADASHELRTPVTSLRTNIEVLLADSELPEPERRRLLADVVEQSEELTALVGDLIELARGDLPEGGLEEVRLDRVAAESLARSRRNSPDLEVRGRLDPVVVRGAPERLGRAINNLLDNAARHCPPGTPVELTVDGSGVTVRDHGPGVPPEDLPHVFDRFYRGASARGRQGSGLGLSIARQVAEQHGGTVAVENHPGGGAVFHIHLPTTPLTPAPEQSSAPARPRDPQLTGDAEAPPQQPEARGEHGDPWQQQQLPLSGVADQQRD